VYNLKITNLQHYLLHLGRADHKTKGGSLYTLVRMMQQENRQRRLREKAVKQGAY
jgi:hypothetical protein